MKSTIEMISFGPNTWDNSNNDLAKDILSPTIEISHLQMCI